MKKSDLSRLLVLPAIIGVLPVELLGINAQLLQRLPILGPNGLPYWDIILFIALIVGLVVIGPLKARLVHWVCMTALLVATCYVLMRSYGPWNQNFGLYLQFTSVVAFTLAANAAAPNAALSKLRLPMIVGGSMVAVSSAALALASLGVHGWWGDQLVQIERFEGIDERIRWATVRLQDRMLMCFITAYCSALAVSRRRFWLFSIPALFVLAQLVQSSRGGVLLVLFSMITGMLFVASQRAARATVNPKFWVSGAACMVAAAGLIAANDRAYTLLSTWTELIEPDGIRNRMYVSAWQILDGNILAGVGYIDLHAQAEWSPFVLPGMLLPLHNMFMQALLYEGLLGVAFWLVPSIVALAASFRLFAGRGTIAIDSRPLVAGFVATTPAFLYMMALQTLDRISLVASWTILGLIAALSNSLRRSAVR